MTTPILSLRAALELAVANLGCIARTTRKEGKWEPVAPGYLERDVEAIRTALAAQPELPEPMGTKVYTAAQLQQGPGPDAYAGAREDLSIWKRRALEAERELRALQAQAKREPMTLEAMQAIFLAAGFTIKEGQQDLKPYVYAAGRAIEAHHHIGDKA